MISINIKDRMAKIPGVVLVEWNPELLTLIIHYKQGIDLEQLKIRVLQAIDYAGLQRGIERADFIPDICALRQEVRG